MSAKATSRIVTLLLGLAIVTGCTLVIPTPAPAISSEPAASLPAVVEPSEFVASKVEDLAGIWETQFVGQLAYMQYNADGTSRLVHKLQDLELDFMGVSGNIWFEGTVLHLEDMNGHGTYEVRVIREGDTPVELAFSEIDDPNTTRPEDLTAGMKWIASSLDEALKASE